MARPIETAPKNGKRILVGDDHGNVAAAFWHAPSNGDKGMWSLALPKGATLIQQIDFTPTRWGETMDEFERD